MSNEPTAICQAFEVYKGRKRFADEELEDSLTEVIHGLKNKISGVLTLKNWVDSFLTTGWIHILYTNSNNGKPTIQTIEQGDLKRFDFSSIYEAASSLLHLKGVWVPLIVVDVFLDEAKHSVQINFRVSKDE